MPAVHPRAEPLLKPGRSESKRERDAFYSGARWMRLRLRFLKANPLCAECDRQGLIVSAEIVHHLIERLKRPDLAYTWSNLESLCNQCHTRHHKATAKDVGLYEV